MANGPSGRSILAIFGVLHQTQSFTHISPVRVLGLLMPENRGERRRRDGGREGWKAGLIALPACLPGSSKAVKTGGVKAEGKKKYYYLLPDQYILHSFASHSLLQAGR